MTQLRSSSRLPLPLLALLGALSTLVVACSGDEEGGRSGGSRDAGDGAGGSSAGGAGAGGTDGGETPDGGSTGGSAAGGSDAGTGGAGGGDADAAPDAEVGCTVTPSMWSAPEFEDNTVVERALRAQLTALTGSALMQGAEAGTATVDELTDMSAAYEAGAPSLASVTTPYFDGLVDDAFGEFLDALTAGTQDLVDAGGFWAPGAQGGIWGTTPRAFNEGGLEVRQIVDKGLFGAATFYNHALGLTTGAITPATVDAIAAALGTNAGLLPGRNNATDVASQNLGAANYAYQMGLYGEIVDALIDARAYAADEACVAERDRSLRALFQTWERAMFVRFAFYANRAVTTVSTSASDDDLASALHDLGEGLGLVLGFYAMPTPSSGPLSGGGKRTSDAQIAEILGAMGVNATGDLGAATTGSFLEDTSAFQTAVAQAESVVATVWNLSPADLAAYRSPTDG